MTDYARRIGDYMQTPEFKTAFKRAVQEDAESSKAARRRMVEQVNANLALEGFEPDEADRINQSRFIDGTMSGDEMFQYARSYAEKASGKPHA